MRRIIGLTGGIAQGKTAVSNILQKRGFAILDADLVSREVQRVGTPCFAAMQKAFPSCFEGGELDRRRLREYVFSDRSALDRLNDIVLPYIKEEIEHKISQTNDFLVLVVPLLYESGMHELCDAVVTVTCSEDVRIKRLMERDTIDSSLAQSMISSQTSDLERLTKADYVLTNDATLEELEAQVATLFVKLQSEEFLRNKQSKR